MTMSQFVKPFPQSILLEQSFASVSDELFLLAFKNTRYVETASLEDNQGVKFSFFILRIQRELTPIFPSLQIALSEITDE